MAQALAYTDVAAPGDGRTPVIPASCARAKERDKAGAQTFILFPAANQNGRSQPTLNWNLPEPLLYWSWWMGMP